MTDRLETQWTKTKAISDTITIRKYMKLQSSVDPQMKSSQFNYQLRLATALQDDTRAKVETGSMYLLDDPGQDLSCSSEG